MPEPRHWVCRRLVFKIRMESWPLGITRLPVIWRDWPGTRWSNRCLHATFRAASMVPPSPGRAATEKTCAWKNTNRLLGTTGYDGIKTGTTSAAGSCLVSGCHREGQTLIAVVLGSSSSDARYIDTRNLYRWAWKELKGSGGVGRGNDAMM